MFQQNHARGFDVYARPVRRPDMSTTGVTEKQPGSLNRALDAADPHQQLKTFAARHHASTPRSRGSPLEQAGADLYRVRQTPGRPEGRQAAVGLISIPGLGRFKVTDSFGQFGARPVASGRSGRPVELNVRRHLSAGLLYVRQASVGPQGQGLADLRLRDGGHPRHPPPRRRPPVDMTATSTCLFAG